MQVMHDLDRQQDTLQSDLDTKAETEASLQAHVDQLEQHIQQTTR